MKRFVKILIPMIVFIIPLLACGESTSNTGTSANGTPASSPAANQKHFKVGDTVTVGNTWKVVVNAASSNPGDDFNKPSKGAYIVVNVSLTNISDKEQNVSSLMDFKLKGTDGTQYSDAITGNLAGVTPAPNGKVASGDIIKGDLIYDAPADAKTFKLAFAPSLFSSGQTIWDISL